MSSVIADLPVAVTEALGAGSVTPLRHDKQRNRTWLVDTTSGSVVVKRYRWMTGQEVDAVLRAEARVREAGIPVPAVLRRFAHGTVVVYAQARGTHLLPDGPDIVDACAELFARQLDALSNFVPTWMPTRPTTLPTRAAEAAASCCDAHLARTITTAWRELARLATERPATASHVDWRADNLLFADGEVSAALDWEAVASLPAAEAIGYAAGSCTHSWRTSLSRPLTLPPVVRFLETCAAHRGWKPNDPEAVHARLAALFTCAVRVAEDQQRGAAAVSVNDLHATLER